MTWQNLGRGECLHNSVLAKCSLYFINLVVALGVALSACSSGPVRDTNTAQGAYEEALDYIKDQRYQESITKLNEIKNKHPYSSYAPMAELKIADVYFAMESFAEAQAAYELFREFHPKHPQSDYVLYRIALSYYNRLPDTEDRDLSLAKSAVRYFDELLQFYPHSTYSKEAGEKKTDCFKRMAAKELYIAQFYFKRAMYDSALGRFEYLYKNYPNLGFDATALYGAAASAQKLGQRNRVQVHVKNLLALFPESAEAQRAKTEFK